jgi:hypothetical protein
MCLSSVCGFRDVVALHTKLGNTACVFAVGDSSKATVHEGCVPGSSERCGVIRDKTPVCGCFG